MKNKTSYIFMIFTLLMYNCNNSSKENSNAKNELAKPTQQALAEGYQLTEDNCFLCHSPNAKEEDKIAPTMAEIKKHYVTNNVSTEQFTQDLTSFLHNPSEEKSKMPDAIKQYGLMPEMDYIDEDIIKIASYIYFTELEKPDWFENHYQEETERYTNIQSSNLSALEKGKEITMKAKAVLGKNLQEAIIASGTENALSFCSIKAIPLTDSIAISVNASIKRVTDKNRNPENKANELELSYIESAKLAIAQGKTPQPQLTVLDDKQIGYYPIMTNKMCLQCHGQSETEISPKTLSKISNLYPNDMATGYEAGELRGIWVVEMKKNSQ